MFLQYPGTPLTNNEAERCIRGSVILRKICFGTSSDRGDKFRSRVLSVIETCKSASSRHSKCCAGSSQRSRQASLILTYST